MAAGKIDDLLAEQICQRDGGPVRKERENPRRS
jgi:hypothetical protein